MICSSVIDIEDVTFAVYALQDCYFGLVLTCFVAQTPISAWTVWSGFVSPKGIQFTLSKTTPWYESKHVAVGQL